MAQHLISPNLPIVLTSFIGRQREIAEISQLLASAHLVSLVGAGGCGKYSTCELPHYVRAPIPGQHRRSTQA